MLVEKTEIVELGESQPWTAILRSNCSTFHYSFQACKTADCPTYTKLTAPKRTRKSLFAALPIGTQISFYCRPLEVRVTLTFWAFPNRN